MAVGSSESKTTRVIAQMKVYLRWQRGKCFGAFFLENRNLVPKLMALSVGIVLIKLVLVHMTAKYLKKDMNWMYDHWAKSSLVFSLFFFLQRIFQSRGQPESGIRFLTKEPGQSGCIVRSRYLSLICKKVIPSKILPNEANVKLNGQINTWGIGVRFPLDFEL